MTIHLQSDIKFMETLKKTITVLKIHTSNFRLEGLELCEDCNHKRKIILFRVQAHHVASLYQLLARKFFFSYYEKFTIQKKNKIIN
jgi:hypothetical protein